MLPGLSGAYGYDYSAIQVVFDACDIAKEKRPGMMELIIGLIAVDVKEQRKAVPNNAG